MSVKEKIGTVVSDKMQKTIVVMVNRRIKHKRYGKVVVVSKRYIVRDIDFNTQVGDEVRIQETRPVSKTVHWVVTEVLRKGSLN
jgi:small subunit ribosomal protein S17